MKTFILIVISMTLPCTAFAGADTLLNTRAPYFSLMDQNGQAYNIRQSEGEILILLAADKEGEVQLRQWRPRLRERYNNSIFMMGIADLRIVPSVLKNSVKNNFKKDSRRILLDWNGEVFQSYQLAPGVAHIVLIDKNQVIRYVAFGEATKAGCERLFIEIDRWNKE